MHSIFNSTPRGKILLTGEYFVLGGALALAMPVKMGQQIEIFKENIVAQQGTLLWSSLEPDHSEWFRAHFSTKNFDVLHATDTNVAQRLAQILQTIRSVQPHFFTGFHNFLVKTRNQFPRQWGLGTSSTLLAGLAKFADIDPYFLLKSTFGGSGYDLACAFAEQPILFQLVDGIPNVQTTDFQPVFSENLYFLYLGKKMDSRRGIQIYKEKIQNDSAIHLKISQLTTLLLTATDFNAFNQTIREHEKLVSLALELPMVKPTLFPNFWGEIKSLGAWGGDFVLVTSTESAEITRQFFNDLGYSVFLKWSDLAIS